MVAVETFRQMALSMPGSVELPHFDKASFRVNKKIFATLDTKTKKVCLLLNEVDQSVFTSFDKTIIYPVPNKWGNRGATYVELLKVRRSMLKDAVSMAYQNIAKVNRK